MTTFDEQWVEFLTQGYIASIRLDDSLVALSQDIVPLVAESLAREGILPPSGQAQLPAIGAALLADGDLRAAVGDVIDDSALAKTSEDLVAPMTPQEQGGFGGGDFMASLGLGATVQIDFTQPPDENIVSKMLTNNGGLYDPPEDEENLLEFDGVIPTLSTYVDKIAEENGLIVVPELFRDTQLYRNLHEKGWIRKINPSEEETKAEFDPSAFGNDAEVADETQKGFDTVLNQQADADIFDATGYYVFTEQAEKRLPDWFDEMGIPFDRTNTDAVAEYRKAMDFIANNYRGDGNRDDLVLSLTGDATIPVSPSSYIYNTEEREFHVRAEEVDRWQQETGLMQHSILRFIKQMHDEFGEVRAKDSWQMVLMAMEENDDYTEDGVHVNSNILARDAKFAKYISLYDDAANTYKDAEGNVYNELAYLHLIHPEIAGKIWDNRHDELTVGEVRAIQDAYSTMDTFHNRYGFTPGFSYGNEGRAFIDGLEAGRMSEAYKFAQGYEAVPDEFKQFLPESEWEKSKAKAEESDREDFFSTQDPTKLKATEEAFSNMYKQWFLDDPSDRELERFMSWWAGKENDYRRDAASYNYYTAGGVSSPYLDPESPAGAQMEQLRLGMNQQEFLRDDPRYSQMYGRKPTGMTEMEYRQAFTNRAEADYGSQGALNPDLIRAGMESGDPTAITRAGIMSGEGYNNSQYMRKIMTLRNAFRRET